MKKGEYDEIAGEENLEEKPLGLSAIKFEDKPKSKTLSVDNVTIILNILKQISNTAENCKKNCKQETLDKIELMADEVSKIIKG